MSLILIIYLLISKEELIKFQKFEFVSAHCCQFINDNQSRARDRVKLHEYPLSAEILYLFSGRTLILRSDCGRACAFLSRTKCKVNSLRGRRSTGRVSCVILARGHRVAENRARVQWGNVKKVECIYIFVRKVRARARSRLMLKSAVSRLHTRGLLHMTIAITKRFAGSCAYHRQYTVVQISFCMR